MTSLQLILCYNINVMMSQDDVTCSCLIEFRQAKGHHLMTNTKNIVIAI